MKSERRKPSRRHARRSARHSRPFPSIPLREDFTTDFYSGAFEENMVVAVESLIGEEGGQECVKLETQVIITKDGPVRMDSYPWEDER